MPVNTTSSTATVIAGRLSDPWRERVLEREGPPIDTQLDVRLSDYYNDDDVKLVIIILYNTRIYHKSSQDGDKLTKEIEDYRNGGGGS